MEYKLSPSSLNLLEDCPRCFWLKTVKKIKRPMGPMSSIPIKMDSIIKHYFNKYRDLGKLPPIIEGHRLYYNFIKPHESLDGKTPSEEAGITIEGDNKWLTLMKTAMWYQKKKVLGN